MADRKVSQLPTLSLAAGEDLLLIIDDPAGTPVSKKIRVDDLLGYITANVSITGTLTVNNNATFNGSNTIINGSNTVFNSNTTMKTLVITADKVVVRQSKTPSTNSDSVGQGSIFWDQNYLYVAIANTTIRRVALNTF
jgi:hypothetical protein